MCDETRISLPAKLSLTRTTLGQLCVAPRTSRSQPAATEPGREPRVSGGTASTASTALDHCATREVSSLYPYQSLSPCHLKASPKHDAATSMLHSRDDVKTGDELCLVFFRHNALHSGQRVTFLYHHTTESFALCSESLSFVFLKNSRCDVMCLFEKLFLRTGFRLAALP